MKKLYSITLILFASFSLFAQTTLAPGDVIVTSLVADANDRYEFIPLVDLEAGTLIYFTESGWNATTGDWRNGDTTEGVLKYTAPAAVAAGTVISFEEDSSTSDVILPTDGSIVVDSGLGNSWALSTSGDQIIVFQGTPSNPTFIFCVTSHSSAWHDADNTNRTAIPTGLTEGTTAVAAGSGTGSGDEFDNVYYDAVANPLVGKTQAEILALVGNAANWLGDNSTPTDDSWKIQSFTLSSEFLEIENLSIYPNPIKRETRVLNVISSNKETIDVNIYDLLGKNYISGQVVNDKVDVSNLTSGVYIAKFNQGDRQSSKRIIVK